MKRTILLFLFLAIAATSCKKDPSIKNIVFKGKYLGKGCWQVIQVLQPSLSSVGIDRSDTKWVGSLSSAPSYHDTIYFNAVGAGLVPDTFRNKQPFYFTISAIKSNIIHVMDCSIPKYTFVIKDISFSKAKLNKNAQ